MIARLIPPGGSVTDVGAGLQNLRKLMPESTMYTPVDLIKRTTDTVVVDLNEESPEKLPQADYGVFSGVIEYIHTPSSVLAGSRARFKFIIVTYAAARKASAAEYLWRSTNGWVNHYSETDFELLLEKAGWAVLERSRWGDQIIFLAESRHGGHNDS